MISNLNVISGTSQAMEHFSLILHDVIEWMNNIGESLWTIDQVSVDGLLIEYQPEDIHVGYINNKPVAGLIVQNEDALFWPNVARAIEPLQRNDFRLIWHSDGNVLPLVDTIIDLGFAGFQGFQEELGVHIADLIKKPPKNAGRLLFFGSISVTSTLPWGTVRDVRNAVEHSIEVTDGKGLFIQAANTINPEVPLENIRAMYEWPKVYSRTRDQCCWQVNA